MSVVTPPATNTEIGNGGAGASLTQLSAIAWATSNVDIDTIQASRLVPAFSSGTTREFSWFQNKNFRVIWVRGVSNGGSGASASITSPNTSSGQNYSYRYDTYSTIQLTCSPAYGYTFSHWAYGSASAPTLGSISNSNPVSIASTDWTSTSYFNIWCVCNAPSTTSFCAMPGFTTTSYAGAQVNTIALTNDSQKLYCGGRFQAFNFGGYGGSSSSTGSKGIIRLNLDGTIDTGFDVGAGFDIEGPINVSEILVQSDNKVIAIGWFTTYKGTTANKIARLNSDGTLDTGFSTGSGFSTSSSCDAFGGAIQSDGKIIVVGEFDIYNGTSIGRGLTRLNTDGSRDTGFSTGTGVGGGSFSFYIRTAAIQSDGKILIGGYFSQYNGTSCGYNIARLNTNGSLDTSFNTGTGTNEFGYVENIKVLSTGKIMLVGSFTSYNGNSAAGAVRINSDGSYDSSFTFSTTSSNGVYDMIETTTGKYLFGGYFFNYAGQSIQGLVMTETSGSQYTTFNVGSSLYAFASAILETPSGQFLVAGAIDTYKSDYEGLNLILLGANGTAVETCSWPVNYDYTRTSASGSLTIEKNLTNQVIVTSTSSVDNSFSFTSADTIRVYVTTTASSFFLASAYGKIVDSRATVLNTYLPQFDPLWEATNASGSSTASVTSPILNPIGVVDITAISSEY
jgi:uncharacterized delta-60 repeat protein